MLPVAQMGDALLGEVFGIEAIEVSHILQRLEMLEAAVGDPGMGKIELAEMAQLGNLRHVGVGNPGAAEIQLDNLSGGVLHRLAFIERVEQQKRTENRHGGQLLRRLGRLESGSQIMRQPGSAAFSSA